MHIHRCGVHIKEKGGVEGANLDQKPMGLPSQVKHHRRIYTPQLELTFAL